MPPTDPSGPARAATRAIAAWLFVCAAMVFVMVVLGGVTRLTESGLSIVSWRPVTGWLPPLSDADWQALYDAYRESPEFRRANFWMEIDDFKGIFWLEYLHRLWGRLIGVVLLVPFLYFLLRRRMDARLTGHLGAVLLLFAAQGLLGWYMVRSGLVDVPAVSQYRLAAHLSLAVVIYGYLLWLGFRLVSSPGSPRGHGLALVALAWAFLTLVAGAFVAGLDAGLVYNTFPLMDGRLVPRDLFALDPWPLNLFENAATVQFVHRTLAILLVVYLVAAWLAAGRRPAFGVLALAGLAQAGLGISTLLLGVPVALAACHQAGAIAVVTAAVWAVSATRRGTPSQAA